jgi:hypothetical protein
LLDLHYQYTNFRNVIVNFPQLKVPAFLLSTGLVAGALLGSASMALTQPAKPAQPGSSPTGEQKPPANSPSSAPAQVSWQKFRSPAGRFSIVFPVAPTEKSDGESGLRTYLSETSNGFYMVMYADAASVNEAKQISNALPGEFVKGIKGKITSQKKISLQRNPGQEFRFEADSDGEKVLGKGRIYQVGKRFYMLVSAAPDQESGKFLNSFGLI